MITLCIDLEDGYISVIDNDVTPKNFKHNINDMNEPDKILVSLSESGQLYSACVKNLDLSGGMEFHLTDKNGTVFTSTMIGSALVPSDPEMPRCEKHGGMKLPAGYFCLECFKETGEKRRKRRERRHSVEV